MISIDLRVVNISVTVNTEATLTYFASLQQVSELFLQLKELPLIIPTSHSCSPNLRFASFLTTVVSTLLVVLQNVIYVWSGMGFLSLGVYIILYMYV